MKPTLLTPYQQAELWSKARCAVHAAKLATDKQDNVAFYTALDDMNWYANQMRADAAAQAIANGKRRSKPFIDDVPPGVETL